MAERNVVNLDAVRGLPGSYGTVVGGEAFCDTVNLVLEPHPSQRAFAAMARPATLGLDSQRIVEYIDAHVADCIPCLSLPERL